MQHGPVDYHSMLPKIAHFDNKAQLARNAGHMSPRTRHLLLATAFIAPPSPQSRQVILERLDSPRVDYAGALH